MRAYAKINIALNNLGLKENMHELDMVVCEIELFDDIYIEKVEKDIVIEGMDIPLESNLIYKAAVMFLEYNKIKSGLKIKIEKRIPSEAGLGGGSSDACAVLKLLNELFETNNSIEQLESMAIKLGSDVPFFLYGGISRVSGIGQKIKKISNKRLKNIIIIKPPYGFKTKDVFRESDKYEVIEKKAEIDRIELLIKENKDYTKFIFNDLEAPANNLINRVDDIYYYKSKLLECGAKSSLMTGSGSCVVGFVEDDIDEVYNRIVQKLKYEKICKI